LRRFELALLRELGYEVALCDEASSGVPVDPDERYVYIIERGPVLLGIVDADAESGLPLLRGQTLLDMAGDEFDRPETALQSKQLLRMLINHYLGGQILQSRRVLKELQEL